jgi:hypothetical protein
LGAIAQSKEPTPKPATPATKMRRSPSRSVSEPASRISALSVSRYAFDVHCWPASPPPRSRPIAGSATLTADESTAAMVEARMALMSASCLFAVAGGAGVRSRSAMVSALCQFDG